MERERESERDKRTQHSLQRQQNERIRLQLPNNRTADRSIVFHRFSVLFIVNMEFHICKTRMIFCYSAIESNEIAPSTLIQYLPRAEL